MADEILRITDLHKSFGPIEVLKGIDLKVSKGDAVVILGASGSGKSTLLRCVNFLEIPTQGSIHLNGELVGRPAANNGNIVYRERDLGAVRAQIGMVFQQFNLFPHLTVVRNVMLGQMRVLGRSEKEAREKALLNLDKVGILHKSDEYPTRLSGGQQQRVAIARSLAMDPQLMLFDEATSALDPELVGEVLLTMRKLAEDGMTMLIVTHELGFAYNVADRVVYLHDGLVHEEGAPADVLGRPTQERTRDFLRSHTLFRMPDYAA